MKKCPSCSAECEVDADLCLVCGHAFASAPKKTMMGFPSLAAALEEAEESKPKDVGSQTLFGFPAQKAEGSDDPSPPVMDDDEDDATSIIPASAFAFDAPESSEAAVEQPPEFDGPTMEKDLRGTIAGMSVETGEEYTDDATEMVSGTAVFPGMRVAVDDETDDGDLRSQGTLMGMTLADLQAAAPPPADGGRSTQFAIPAVQAEKIQQAQPVKPKVDEGQITDSPTQAWSPASLDQANDIDNRKKLLEKIRKSRPVDSAVKKPAGASSGPDLSALKSLKSKLGDSEATDDDRDTNEQPSAAQSGVLRLAKQREPSPPEEDGLDALSDPEFGLMETGVASADLLQQAISNYSPGAPTSEVADSHDKSAPEPVRHSTPAPASTAAKSVFETFDGGAPSSPSSPDIQKPSAQPSQPTAAPVMTQPTQVPSAQQHAQPQQTPMMPQQARSQPLQPYQPPPPAMSPDDDQTVRYLQGGFGCGAGALALAVQAAVLLTAGIPDGIGGIAVIALGVILGLTSFFGALGPLPATLRSTIFYSIAVAMFACAGLGLFVGLPKLFLVLGLGGMLAAVAGAFPSFAKLLA